MTLMFGGKLEQVQNKLGELITGGRQVENGKSSMTLDARLFACGGNSSNERPLGVMTERVFKGQAAGEALELSRQSVIEMPSRPFPSRSLDERLRKLGVR